MNDERSAQPEIIKENQSVDLSVPSTLAKLPVEYQLPPQPLTEQQLSLQPPTGREPSPQPPIDRQPSPQPPIDRQSSPKFIAEQHTSSKFSGEKHPSPVGEDYQQPVSMSTVDLNGSKGDLHSCQNIMPKPVTDKKPSTKTLPSNFKPAHQPDSMNRTPTPLVPHENLLPEPHSRDVTAGQSKEPNDCQKTQLQWILTTPKIVPTSSSTTNQLFQQYRYPQLPIFSVSNTLNTKFQPQGFGERNSNEVAENTSFLHSQDIINSMSSTSHHKHTSEKLTQMLKLKARQQSSVAKKVKNPVDKKTRLEGIARNIATLQYPPNSMRQLGLPGSSTVAQSAQFAQHHLQQAQIDGSLINDDRHGMRDNFINQRDPRPQGMMNTPAAQNLSKLAHQYNAFFATSHEQQYLPTREDYLQQFARLQDMLRRSSMTPTLDQKAYYQNARMNGGFVIQSQPNPIIQPIQFLPQNVNQYVPINNAYSQEVKGHELMKRYTDETHVIYQPIAPKEMNIQFPAHLLSSQSHQDAEHSQKKQDQQNYRDPRTTNTQNGLPLKSMRNSPIPKPQKVTKRSRSLSTSKTLSQALLDAQRSCLINALNLQERVNQSFTKFNNTNLAAISQTQTIELASSTENTKVQPIPSSNQIQATQFTLVQNEHNCQCSGMKKTMINRATETDLMMDVSHSVEAIAGSSPPESVSRAVESMCQTDQWLEKEEGSLYQETSSDSENATDNEIESENEVVPEANKATLGAEQNLTQKNQHKQSRIIVEQDTLDMIGTLFTQMGANLSLTRNMFDGLRNSYLVCAQTYKALLGKVDKLNSIEPLQNSASPPNNVISQVTKEILAGDNDNTTGVDNATTSIHELRSTFSLPPEYDPNDTKWTLKYRENKRGLVELIPRTGVYVKRKELKRCIRESNDCRTLARLLLTEVFSQNALSVCTWTGGKAKAFNSVNIDIRPGLDENARMVLLTFVEQHGKKCGWSMANTSAVMSTIRTKINDIRAKYEQTCKV
ncbi:GSCOCT00013085001.2-RA-CDS [Cotesia congregata]|uniref:Cc_ben.13_27.2_pseudo n=1 Tax=Cotesia congregata TaxID=51543 RepID=A0A8J2HDX9_COTCN|nr:GSCOCT00013085001.2-RA-CDS [Cotesia congregata]CAG5092504.1 cc_ben.13_27.2_pseudo [Cotesia congregata]